MQSAKYLLIVLFLALSTIFIYLKMDPLAVDRFGIEVDSRKVNYLDKTLVKRPSVEIPVSDNEQNGLAGRNGEDIDHADAAHYAEWYTAQGHFSKDALRDYSEYDEITLLRLGEKGDLKALNILAYMYYAEGDVDKTKKILRQAAVYGSTIALTFISTIAQTDYFYAKDPSIKERFAIEAIAYLEVAIGLGNFSIKDNELAHFNKVSGFIPNGAQTEEIRLTVENISNEILAERSNLGLSDTNSESREAALKMHTYIHGLNTLDKN